MKTLTDYIEAIKAPGDCLKCRWRDAEYFSACMLNMKDYNSFEEQYAQCPLRKIEQELKCSLH